MELSTDFFKILTPVLIGTTYLSAFKDGTPTCNRFIINYFLYLLTSFAIYFTAIKVYDEKDLQLKKGIRMILSIAFLMLVIAIVYVKNVTAQHFIYLAILLIMAYLQRFHLQKIKKEVIEETLKKMMVIIVISMVIAIKYPQYMNDSFIKILFFGLIFIIIFRIFDIFLFDKKYHDIISSFAVFIFACLIMYDTNRVIQASKSCRVKGGNPNYVDHVLDLFMNLVSLFKNLSDVLDE